MLSAGSSKPNPSAEAQDCPCRDPLIIKLVGEEAPPHAVHQPSPALLVVCQRERAARKRAMVGDRDREGGRDGGSCFEKIGRTMGYL